MTSKAAHIPVDLSRNAALGEATASPHRQRIIEAALVLLTEGGRDAVTTRAVAEAAGVQPPVLYRIFQDKRGLLGAMAEYGFALYLSEKRQPHPAEDPIQFLRDGWARHVEFGLAHPELYLLMYADPHPHTPGGHSVPHAHPGLRIHMRRIADAGRLRLPVNLAADLFHAAASGVVITLLGASEQHRDMALARVACDAALATILTGVPAIPDAPAAAAANLLRERISDADGETVSAQRLFTKAEASLMLEWLSRLIKPLP